MSQVSFAHVANDIEAGAISQAGEVLESTADTGDIVNSITLTNRIDDIAGGTGAKLDKYKVIRRNNNVADFEPAKIGTAMMKAFIAVEGAKGEDSSRARDLVGRLTNQVVATLTNRLPDGGVLHIEHIQDQVELALMRAGEHEISRAYVLYREQRAQKRAQEQPAGLVRTLNITRADGSLRSLDQSTLLHVVKLACADLGDQVSPEKICNDAVGNLYDGVAESDLWKSVIFSSRALIEQDPAYSFVTARLLLHHIRHEVLGEEVDQVSMKVRYAEYFPNYLKRGVEAGRIDERLLTFDLARLASAIDANRDLKFQYLGLQTLYDRYLLHVNETRIELPQAFWMRVAMGLAINEVDRETRTIEFYNLLSNFDFVSSTPTLFNSGTRRPQLSSCFLTTVSDDLSDIYEAIRENALLSKYSGGLGNDWTPIRALGAHIKGTNGKSQGVVPFLKVVNDTAVAVNQCFAPDTRVFTADGIKAIKDVAVGDLVLGQRGQYREVTEHMLYNQTGPMVEVNVKQSILPLKVTAGHPFWAITGVPIEQRIERTTASLAKGKTQAGWVEAGKLRKGDYVALVIPKEVVPVAGFTSDDARLYGILLGDGHFTSNDNEWGVSGNPSIDTHLQFVRNYLDARGIHYWVNTRNDNYCQIKWAAGQGVVRDGTTGRYLHAGAPTLPFTRSDIYGEVGNKRIARRFSHLPKEQTLALIHGLLETDGGVSRSCEIYFTNSSQELTEGLRYQLLRLGIPTAGQYREREQGHSGMRSDGTEINFNGTCKAYDLRIPAVKEIADLVDCKAVTRKNWFIHEGAVFSRVRSQCAIQPLPFVYDLKVEGDETYMTTAALVHNGGKRKGAVCAYLETWHLDIEEFLELRKNTGDDRRRTHDMNTANWIPDLFMERLIANQDWTLFSPEETPDLHDLYGPAFKAAYERYEGLAAEGQIKNFKRIPAVGLWRKMLSMLFETGHPWITFKDACNLRSPQQHAGVVHSSNLCTEITLNTSETETAVCNLGSVNLIEHLVDGKLDLEKLQNTCKIAMRMLDNVIDINYYSVPKARNSNMRHRPVGLGLMGFQDALLSMRVPYASREAVEFADYSQEAVSYFAILASSQLASERGTYPSYKGSLWDQGILPIDSIEILAQARATSAAGKEAGLEQDRSSKLDWQVVRDQISKSGMRNSNCLAIAPTATIANIAGVSPSIEPTFQNLYVKSNLSGEFTVLNSYLVEELKARGLWDDVMIHDLKYFDGSVIPIERIPEELKHLYATAFEIDPRWLVECGSRRQKWIDQSQSLNLYMSEASGRKLNDLYMMAWKKGLKTTYYLRTMSATYSEKSTVNNAALNAVAGALPANALPLKPAVCDPNNSECEACQ